MSSAAMVLCSNTDVDKSLEKTTRNTSSIKSRAETSG